MSLLQERMAQAKQHYEKTTNKKFRNTDLAAYCNVSKASVGQWFNGPTKVLEGANLTLAAEFFGVNHKWLAGESSQMVSSTEDQGFSNVSFVDLPFRKIPILDYVQAGLFHDVAYDGINPRGETYTTYIGAKPEEVFSLIIEGLSMAPIFMPGDKIVVDGSLSPQPGSFVIAQNGQIETTFKKYRVTGYDEYGREQFELVPLNPDFPVISSREHNISIIGVMVRHMRDYK